MKQTDTSKTFKNPSSASGAVVRNLLESNKDKIFNVVFTKQDGTLRRMQCKLGVTSKLKGGESTHKEYQRNLVVFDTKKQAYRTVNCETVCSISMKGLKLTVEQ